MLDLDRLFMNAVTAESAERTIDSAGDHRQKAGRARETGDRNPPAHRSREPTVCRPLRGPSGNRTSPCRLRGLCVSVLKLL